MLGEQLDKSYIKALKSTGTSIGTSVVMAAATGILTGYDRILLVEHGGHISISKAWAISLLKRMTLQRVLMELSCQCRFSTRERRHAVIQSIAFLKVSILSTCQTTGKMKKPAKYFLKKIIFPYIQRTREEMGAPLQKALVVMDNFSGANYYHNL